MYCSKCGKQIEDGSRFCQFCGTKLKYPPGNKRRTDFDENKEEDNDLQKPVNAPEKKDAGNEDVRCSKCGKKISYGIEYCPYCNEKQVNVTDPELSESDRDLSSDDPQHSESKTSLFRNPAVIITVLLVLVSIGLITHFSGNKTSSEQGPSNSAGLNDSSSIQQTAVSGEPTAKADIVTGMTTGNRKNLKEIQIYAQSGVTYIHEGSKDSVLEEKSSAIGYFQVRKGEEIRIRSTSGQSGSIVGHVYEYAQIPYYDVKSDSSFTWYQIDSERGYWVADDGNWIVLY